MNVAILGYGIYIPRYRIKTSDIAKVWGKDGADIEWSLGVSEKSVASLDEDAVTIAYEAAKAAILQNGISASQLEVCFVGSESHPYAVNPTSTIVGEFLGIGRNYLAADLEFACKAATAGMLALIGLIEAKMVSYGLVIGSDTAQAKPHDILEYTAASAGAAFILGKETEEALAKVVETTSYSSDTPDFWRRDGVRYPTHGGRFTGEPAYFDHVEQAARNLLAKVKKSPSDFDYCVFHSPNGKFPRQVAKRLGFTYQQLAPSLIVDEIGNPYTASTFMGIAKVLDIAKPKEKIFIISYGSGAGSDGIILETTPAVVKKHVSQTSFAKFQEQKQYISYVQSLKFGKKI